MNLNNNFDLNKTLAGDYFRKSKNTEEIIPNIKQIILDIGASLDDSYIKKDNDIWISKTADVADTALIIGPCIIDDNASIRHSSYIRGSVLVGKNAVVGNSCELKNCILFDNAKVSHFNYIGDSILGHKSHFGSCAVTSNRKLDKSDIIIHKTNLSRMGAIVGDRVEVGCNTVLYPGTIIGRNTNIYPLNTVKGEIGSNVIVKSIDNIINKRQVYLDFDNTIYNTDKMFKDIKDKCMEYGITEDEILKVKLAFKLFNMNEVLDIIKNSHEFDDALYEEIDNIVKNGKSYIFDDVYDFISELKNKKYQVNILTFGDYSWQYLKISNSGIENYVNDIIITEDEKSKLDYINYSSSIFIDDDPKQILGFLDNNPSKVIRIKRVNCSTSSIVLDKRNVLEYETLKDMINLF